MMKTMPKFVDMAMSSEERKESMSFCTPADAPAQPVYPYGLCLYLEQDELEKLGMTADAGVGDMVMLTCMAKVTNVSSRDTTDGPRNSMSLQITAMAAEGDDDGDEQPAARPARRPGNLYAKK